MTAPLRPAMNCTEWQLFRRIGQTDQRQVTIIRSDGHRESVTIPGSALERLNHATAAACLDGQAFGFTPYDVRDLTDAARLLGGTGGQHYPARLRALADRIAALLPPE